MRVAILVAVARCGVALALAVSPLLAGAAAWVQQARDADAVSAVWTYIRHKDCPGAVRELNAGVARQYPGVLLLAGAMFEDGVCLKANWPKALDFYQRAHESGHPRAAARIASGFAAPVGGPDKAAALWWALRSGTALPGACRQAAPFVDDADRFVQALQSWPASTLDACAYVAGVITTIWGDMDFSSRAALYGIKGAVTLSYLPAQGRVDVATDRLEFVQLQGLVDGDAVRDRASGKFKSEFAQDVQAAADRALRRYARPAVLDESWKVDLLFTFEFVTCATCR